MKINAHGGTRLPSLLRRLACLAVLLLAGGLALAADRDDRQTKTPYAPRQPIASLEPVPAGYAPVFTQLLARHGSRGLTGMKSDLALYRLWQQAQQEGALTPLGRELGTALQAMLRANFLLGVGVPGISEPGYGNETLTGLQEHEALARRLVQRLPALFEGSAVMGARKLVVVSSGKDRAVDSAAAFTDSLLALRPTLRAALDGPHSDRYLLYFHRLPNTPVPDAQATLHLQTWQDSQAYQAYAHGPVLQAQLARIRRDPRLQQAAAQVLQALFQPDFVARLAQGKYRFSNTGTLSFSTPDGHFTKTLSGDGRSSIASVRDAAWALYDLYAISAGMRSELEQAGSSVAAFERVMPPQAAAVFAQAEDAEDFYSKGPGLIEQGEVTSHMATILLQDFFSEADAIAQGRRDHLAKLRFAHAEIVIPLATLMGLPGMARQASELLPYDPQHNGWRGTEVAPMAANLQWDMFADASGGLLVRLLYNEGEMDFKPACDSARIAPQSHFYDYRALRLCYGQPPLR